MDTQKQLDTPGCHGFGTRREQFRLRAEFIVAVNAASSMDELEKLAREVPSLVHNVSAAPAADAVERRAQELVPVKGGYLLNGAGELEYRNGR